MNEAGTTSGTETAVMRGILRRVGIDEGFFQCVAEATSGSQAVAIPSPTDPKLEALRAQYAVLSWPVTARSQWNSGFIKREIPFDRFRADSGYIWQHRDLNSPASYILTALYYASLKDEAAIFSRMREDGAFGAYTLPWGAGLSISRDLLDSVSEISFLQRHGVIGADGTTLLDIGSGYGRFAHRMFEAFDSLHTVLCVDAIPESTFLSGRYLSHRGVSSAPVVELPRLPMTLENRHVDAALSIHVFSECPLAATEWWIDILRAHNVRYLFVVPNAEDFDGKFLLSKEADGRRLHIEGALLARGYQLKVVEPKYLHPQVQRFGISPTHYFLFDGC